MRTRLVGVTGIGKQALWYYLLAETREDRQVYGLRVKYCGEVVSIADITSSRKQIHRLLRRMLWGGVTPVTARDVVEDWLGGEFSL